MFLVSIALLVLQDISLLSALRYLNYNRCHSEPACSCSFLPKKHHVDRNAAQLKFSCLPLIWCSWGRTARTVWRKRKKCMYTCHKGQSLNPLQCIIVTYVPNVRLPGYQETQDIALSQILCLVPESVCSHIPFSSIYTVCPSGGFVMSTPSRKPL